MTFTQEGLRLKQTLDPETCLSFANAWKKYADDDTLSKYKASMLLICCESGLAPLKPVDSAQDVYQVIEGMIL